MTLIRFQIQGNKASYNQMIQIIVHNSILRCINKTRDTIIHLQKQVKQDKYLIMIQVKIISIDLQQTMRPQIQNWITFYLKTLKQNQSLTIYLFKILSMKELNEVQISLKQYSIKLKRKKYHSLNLFKTMMDHQKNSMIFKKMLLQKTKRTMMNKLMKKRMSIIFQII